MHGFLLTIHVIACLMMVLLILLQPSKGAGLVIYGGGGDTLFSTPSGTSFMKKLTAGFAITFACTSLLLTIMSTRIGLDSVTTRTRLPAAPAQAPAQSPAQPPAQDKAPTEKPPKK